MHIYTYIHIYIYRERERGILPATAAYSQYYHHPAYTLVVVLIMPIDYQH